MGFFRQEYWSGLPFPPPGDLPNPGIEIMCPVSSLQVVSFFFFLQVVSLPTEPLGKPHYFLFKLPVVVQLLSHV